MTIRLAIVIHQNKWWIYKKNRLQSGNSQAKKLSVKVMRLWTSKFARVVRYNREKLLVHFSVHKN